MARFELEGEITNSIDEKTRLKGERKRKLRLLAVVGFYLFFPRVVLVSRIIALPRYLVLVVNYSRSHICDAEQNFFSLVRF